MPGIEKFGRRLGALPGRLWRQKAWTRGDPWRASLRKAVQFRIANCGRQGFGAAHMQECCPSKFADAAPVEGDTHSERFREGIIAAIPKLRAYARNLLGSATDADDLVQEALMRAWKSRLTFERGTNLNAWMFRILRNEFLNDASRRRRLVADVDDLMASRLTCAPEQEWHLQFVDVVAALPRLSAELREAVLLVVAAGHSYEDAAAICACSVTAMKQRVRRAKLRLAEITDPKAPPWSRSRSNPALSVH